MCGISLRALHYAFVISWITFTEMSHILKRSCTFVWVLCDHLVDVTHYVFIFQWMIATDGLYILKQRFALVRVTGWWISNIRTVCHVCGDPFQISGNVFGIQDLFMRLGSCSAKTSNKWLRSNVYSECLHLISLTGTWMPFWDDVILIWYHYILICTLVTIFNWRSNGVLTRITITRNSEYR